MVKERVRVLEGRIMETARAKAAAKEDQVPRPKERARARTKEAKEEEGLQPHVGDVAIGSMTAKLPSIVPHVGLSGSPRTDATSRENRQQNTSHQSHTKMTPPRMRVFMMVVANLLFLLLALGVGPQVMLRQMSPWVCRSFQVSLLAILSMTASRLWTWIRSKPVCKVFACIRTTCGSYNAGGSPAEET